VSLAGSARPDGRSRLMRSVGEEQRSREVECEQAAIAMDGDTDGRRGASCRRRQPLRRSRERSRNQARDQRPEQMLPKIQWTGKNG